MQEVEVTWPRAIKVWWSFMWRATLFAAIAGVVIGVVLGFISLAAGGIGDAAEVVGVVMGIPAGMLAMKLTLNVKYSDFRLALVPVEET